MAPIISDIVLGYIDRQLEGHLAKLCSGVFRYVDNFAVFCNTDIHSEGVDEIIMLFRQHGMGLAFSYEVAKNNKLQFLDLSLTFGESRVVEI